MGVDTALQNTAVAVLAEDGHRVISVRKPFPDGKVMDGVERMIFVRDFLLREVVQDYVQTMEGIHPDNPGMVALEDYPMSPFNDAYLTAELIGILKAGLHDRKANYCLVHPMKTHKYVVKRRKVTKTEIIDFVKANFDLSGVELDRKGMSDCCDAIVIAAIGRLTYYCKVRGTFFPMEERWREIILTDGSGILTKPGLAQFFGT